MRNFIFLGAKVDKRVVFSLNEKKKHSYCREVERSLRRSGMNSGGLSRKHLAEKDAARLKRKACLRCDREFLSEGPHNRLCQACREFLAESSTAFEEYFIGCYD